MCGISAIIVNKKYQRKFINFRKEIQKMNNAISHRGPDDEGYFELNNKKEKFFFFGDDTPDNVINEKLNNKNFQHISKGIRNFQSSNDVNVLLGHRRLSIIDLSISAHQPMSIVNDNYIIIFNGEIYNFAELKLKLQSAGVIFESNSDTEVIIKMYEKYGTASFKEFRGMWSFVILDLKLNLIIGCRDRFGIKPLYYFIDQFKNIYIASEIKQFHSLELWKSELNVNRAYDYIIYAQTDHTNETLFKNVYQCPAGNYFKISIENKDSNKKKLEFVNWYNLNENLKKNNAKNYNDELESLLKKSNRLHTISDVPISYSLSGGIDSTILVMEQSANNPKKNIDTFSIFSEDKSIDEKKWVDEILNSTNNIINYSSIPTLENFLDELNTIVFSLDEPPCDSTIFAEWSVYKMISDKNFKVTISGQGADEVFGGYHNYFFSYLLFLLKKFKLTTFIIEVFKIKKIHNYSLTNLTKTLISKFLPNFYYKIKNKFSVDLNKLISLKKTSDYKINKFIAKERIFGIKNLSVHQIKYSMLPKLLRYADRASMHHSVEVRVPYLDHYFVEYGLSISDDYKIRNGITKYVLRNACSKFLPKKIFNRVDKIGFELSSKKWLTSKKQNILLRNLIDELLVSPEGIFNEDTHRYIDQVMRNKIDFNDIVYRIIFFNVWMKVFNVNIK